jgi:hypothetical protein
MLKLSTPYGTRFGFTTRQQYLDFVAKNPRVLPLGRPAMPILPAPAGTHRSAETWCLLGLCLLLALAGILP